MAGPAGPERLVVEAARIVEAAGDIGGIGIDRLTGEGSDRATTEAREVMAVVACDRYGIRVKNLASVFGKRPDLVSAWLCRGAGTCQ